MSPVAVPSHTNTTPVPVQVQKHPRAYINREKIYLRQTKSIKLLFLRNTATVPAVVVKMTCPDCSRSDFTNIQGLLNHCRLRHKREYGSHDECMQQCATVVPEEERDWVIAHGTELGGVSLPGLRRLFEIAVGYGPRSTDELGGAATQGVQLETANADELGTHLSRTLGHHKDSPALAPFLGKAPKRRRITVYDEGTVEIMEDSNLDASPKPAWRMLYTHRNVARPSLDVVYDLAPSDGLRPENRDDLIEGDTIGTRFHMTARVCVSDRSLWVPPGEQPYPLSYI